MDGSNYCISAYYKISKISMCIVGMWPYQSKSLSKFIIYFWIFQHLSILIPEIIKFIEIRNNVDYIIEYCGPIIYNILLSIKYCNSILKKKQLTALLKEIQKDWNSFDNETEIALLNKSASFGKLMISSYLCLCMISTLFYLVFPLSPFILDSIQPLNESRPKRLILFVEFFIDDEKYFLHLLVHSYIVTIFGVVSIIATDTFFINVVQHACGILSVLGFCENINKIYGDSFFFIMGANMILMSFTGVLIILKWGQLNDMIRFTMFTLTQMFHLLFYSIQGQYLMDKSLAISDCLYDSEWYAISTGIKNIITIIIIRSLKPITLNAKILYISLPVFTSVVKTSSSYIAVLKSIR